jgi:hypothetical protein
MDGDNRAASMTEQGVKRLQAQLAAFFLRLDLTVLEEYRREKDRHGECDWTGD